MTGTGKFEALTRIGFAARGLLYLMIGYAALTAARPKGGPEVISDIDRNGPGEALLILMALGFAAYALWRLTEALVDTEGNGSGAKGAAVRGGGLVSGLIHLGLAFLALSLAAGMGREAGSGGGTPTMVAWALGLPGGRLLVFAAAALIAGTGLYQFVQAVKLTFLKHVAAAAARRPWVRWSGRIGYLARGVAFVVIGWLLSRAASAYDPSRAGDVGTAIGAIPSALRGVLGAGLGLFGLFSLVQARYRRIEDPQVIDRLKGVFPGR